MTPFSIAIQRAIKDVRSVFAVQSAALSAHSKRLGDLRRSMTLSRREAIEKL